MHIFSEYLGALWRWRTLLTGVLALVIGLICAEFFPKLSGLGIAAIVLGVAIVIAQFLAWRDARNQRITAEEARDELLAGVHRCLIPSCVEISRATDPKGDRALCSGISIKLAFTNKGPIAVEFQTVDSEVWLTGMESRAGAEAELDDHRSYIPPDVSGVHAITVEFHPPISGRITGEGHATLIYGSPKDGQRYKLFHPFKFWCQPSVRRKRSDYELSTRGGGFDVPLPESEVTW